MRNFHTFRQRHTSHRPQRISTVYVQGRAAGGATSTTSRTSERDDRARLEELTALIQEATQLAISTGPRGIRRAAQAADAFFTVGRTQLNKLSALSPPTSTSKNNNNNASSPFSTTTIINALDPPASILRQLFEKLGATYIKLGQFIASSPTIFPPDLVTEFQKCLDQTDPIPFAQIRKIAEADLGMALEDVFSFVDPVPLASASIAQVHAAVLRNSGKEVVIKVLKPGVEDVLTADLNFLYIATRFLQWAAPDLARTSLAPIVSDIRDSMLGEVDFTKEAQHLAEFSAFLDRSGLRAVATCPSVYKQFSGKKVLVMERLNGVPLSDLEAIRAQVPRGIEPELVLINALNTWLASVVGCPTFHADVHAGNLLVLSDGRVGFIDFGIVGSISQPTWAGVEALLRSTTTGDFDTMARALATIGATEESIDYDAFAGDLKKLFDSLQAIDADLVIAAGTGAVSAEVAVDDAAVNRFLLELVRVGEKHGIKFPREFALLLKQLLYFDRYNRLLAPQLKVFEDTRIDLGGKQGAAIVDVEVL
jgi:aarF domain-containing kinase